MRMAVTSGLVLALGLAAGACQDRSHMASAAGGGGGAGAGICSPFAVGSSDQSAASGADANALDDCLHRWGYRLARANDPGPNVAEAVVAACSQVLSRWNSASLAGPQAGPDTAVSLVTGESNNTPADRYRMAQSKALFYVEQARAGGCAPP